MQNKCRIGFCLVSTSAIFLILILFEKKNFAPLIAYFVMDEREWNKNEQSINHRLWKRFNWTVWDWYGRIFHMLIDIAIMRILHSVEVDRLFTDECWKICCHLVLRNVKSRYWMHTFQFEHSGSRCVQYHHNYSHLKFSFANIFFSFFFFRKSLIQGRMANTTIK